MKQVYRVEGLCCPNCARQVSEAISQLPGVKQAKVQFMLGKLQVESNEDQPLPSLDEMQTVAQRFEAGCTLKPTR